MPPVSSATAGGAQATKPMTDPRPEPGRSTFNRLGDPIGAAGDLYYPTAIRLSARCLRFEACLARQSKRDARATRIRSGVSWSSSGSRAAQPVAGAIE